VVDAHIQHCNGHKAPAPEITPDHRRSQRD
jgi:hypothetical protein